MKKSKFSDRQELSILKQAELAMSQRYSQVVDALILENFTPPVQINVQKGTIVGQVAKFTS